MSKLKTFSIRLKDSKDYKKSIETLNNHKDFLKKLLNLKAINIQKIFYKQLYKNYIFK